MKIRRNSISLIKYLLILIFTLFMVIVIYNQVFPEESFVDLSDSNSDQIKKQNDPTKKIDWHNYTLINIEKKRVGPGEQGKAVVIDKSEQAEITRLVNENGFSGLASDKMSLYRSVNDIRHPNCRQQLYQAVLPSVSIIIPFFEEHWSTLLRTFISALYRSPKGLIKEVILVDDSSTKKFLGKQLDDYIAKNFKGKVRVLRQPKREGLIRTRLLGAKNATGDVLIFLDSHCEANVNWLPPLLDPIAQDYRTVVCPFIDVLDHDTFEYRAQDEGARGAFDWEFFYKRLPLLPEDLKHPEKPFKSPVMAGGLFAISRKWFWELGGYDPGLDIWGGEQYELSFKLWQCGGQMVDAPCSRIGHVYRKFAPFPAVVNIGNFMARNHRRVAEVWMDEYKQFIYRRKPDWLNEDTGDLSAQFAIRKRLNCKSFKWFMTEIAFDLEKHYPSIEPPSSADGEIRSSVKDSEGNALCLDAKFKPTESKVGLEPCIRDNSKFTGEQKFVMTWREDIQLKSRHDCLDVPNSQPEKAPVVMFGCHGQKGNQFWKILIDQNNLIYHTTSGRCLTADGPTRSVYMDKCDRGSPNQQWSLENVKKDTIRRYNLNMNFNF